LGLAERPWENGRPAVPDAHGMIPSKGGRIEAALTILPARGRSCFVLSLLDASWVALAQPSAPARAKGVKLGPRPTSAKVETRIRELRATGMGILKIARQLGIGTSVVQRVVAV